MVLSFIAEKDLGEVLALIKHSAVFLQPVLRFLSRESYLFSLSISCKIFTNSFFYKSLFHTHADITDVWWSNIWQFCTLCAVTLAIFCLDILAHRDSFIYKTHSLLLFSNSQIFYWLLAYSFPSYFLLFQNDACLHGSAKLLVYSFSYQLVVCTPMTFMGINIGLYITSQFQKFLSSNRWTDCKYTQNVQVAAS